ncbi:hypothetical protein BM1_00362 [Bipolaris maydis]|nr:hypothetical protein BM1_00362 [Bipolaris maydis]
MVLRCFFGGFCGGGEARHGGEVRGKGEERYGRYEKCKEEEGREGSGGGRRRRRRSLSWRLILDLIGGWLILFSNLLKLKMQSAEDVQPEER